MLMASLATALSAACGTDAAGDDTPRGTGPLPASTCGRALAVLATDYASTRVSITDIDGNVLAREIISSARGGVGLSAALSGDVVLPASRPPSGALVLIDRYPGSVITWVTPETGAVVGQLSVATGFPSNPHDYLEISRTKAYVSRYESNGAPGAQPFDAGGDLVVIDPEARAVVGHVPFATAGTFLPRPDRMAWMPNLGIAFVLLQRFDRTFSSNGVSELVAVDTSTDRIAWTLPLDAQGCGGIAIAPASDRLAITCAGPLRNRKATSDGSALVIVKVTREGGALAQRVDATALGDGSPFGNGIAFLTEELVLANALGDLEARRSDALYAVPLGTGAPARILQAPQAFVLGDVVCGPAAASDCTGSRRCFIADASAVRVRAYEASSAAPDGVTETGTFDAAANMTLPPRVLGLL